MILSMRWHYNLLFLLLLNTVSFAENKANSGLIHEQNSTFENLNTEKPDVKMIIGEIENIRLIPPNVILKARIDTGAKTTSIDARNITAFERDGKLWVRFVCVAGEKEHTLERKVIKTVQIKRHGKKAQNRYVINMRIILGNVSQLIHVNLNDRKSYTYPVLIGRNLLRDYFIVDVSKKHQLKPKKLAK
ncbi:MAG: hypothetical protein COB07_06775 [Sulfurovum sp.]|nr:MAG: hypothetical protein COB07_06775 [Sulfurovum sp.]